MHQRAAWYDAARAVGREVDADTYVSAPDTDLEAHRARWRRVCEQAPAYVTDELGHARRQQAQAEADAVLLEQQAEAASGDAEAQSLRESAAAQRQQATVTGERAGVLARVQTARDTWQAEHEPLQDRAREAERELRRRGRVVEAPTLEAEPEGEQGALFEIGEPEREQAQQAERETTRDEQHQAAANRAADKQQQRHSETERAADEERQGEREQDTQHKLLDVTPDPAAVARQTTVDRTAEADTEANTEASQLVSERQAIARTAEDGQTLREAETHARWAEDKAAQSREREQQRAEQREAERAERDRREQPETTVDIPEREIPLPPEPEPELELDRDD